jgi:hypothetical protein
MRRIPAILIYVISTNQEHKQVGAPVFVSRCHDVHVLTPSHVFIFQRTGSLGGKCILQIT